MTLPHRSVLDKELSAVRTKIIQMHSLVATAIDDAMDALANRNLEQARSVVARDDDINALRYEIEHETLGILATQRPAASDLRHVMALIFISIELERMGDHASGIASLVERMSVEPEVASLHKLPKMTKRARQMVEESMEAFLERDADKAYAMMRRDDKLDRLYVKLLQETLSEMQDDDYLRRGTYLIWIGHNLERIGDRAINISERVVFMVTGEYYEYRQTLDHD